MKEGILVMERTRHMTALTLLLGLMAFLFSGCMWGGGSPTTDGSTDTGPTSPSTAATVVVSTTEGTGLVDGLPAEYVASLGQRPIVVLFYSPGGLDDEKVLAAVRELRGVYASYTFLTYDYSVPSAYGDLSKDLNLKNLPQTVLINRKGELPDPANAEERWKIWTGYVDKGTLNQALVDLGRE
jgi:ABC-type Fe3+-hydroxamate transport system substrate-binding protein